MLTARSAAFSATGHPAITGRHPKTLEVTAEPAITARATCVVGIGARIPVAELQALRGRVRVELSCRELPGAVEVVEGEVNPYYATPERWVARRSAVLAPDTFLVNASRSAADLDRDFVGALADRSATLDVAVRETAVPDPVALVVATDAAAGPIPPHIAALARQAEALVDLAGPGAGRWRAAFPDLKGPSPSPRTTAVLVRDLSQLKGQLMDGGPRAARVVVWPPGPPGAELLLAAGEAIEPVLYAGAVPSRAGGRRELALRIERSAVAAVVAASPADPQATLDLLARLPDHPVLLPDPSVGWGVAAVRLDPPHAVDDAAPGRLAGLDRHPFVVFLPPRQGETPLVVRPEKLAELLREAGLSGRSIRDVVVALGGDRRGVYRPRA
jgi:hypothetical protein